MGGLIVGDCSGRPRHLPGCYYLALLGFLIISNLVDGRIYGQTVSTGALTGVVFNPAAKRLPGVAIQLVNQETRETESTTSDEEGRFGFRLLSPGKYELQASKPPFEVLGPRVINVAVTEALRIELHLRLPAVAQIINVSSDVLMVQTDNSALGRVVGGATLTNLPLVTRNYAQIAILSPGVVSGVFNAGELGSGGMPLSQISGSSDGIFVHGARSYDNNYQLDGISVNDVQGSGSASGGTPIPNPDTIYEFKVPAPIALIDLFSVEPGRSRIPLTAQNAQSWEAGL